MKLFKSIALCFFTTLSFGACSNVEKQKEGINVIDFKNPKKVCFGRIEMMVPKETEVEYSNFNYNGSNIEVDDSIKTYDAYQKLIHDKIRYLKNEPHETEGTLLKSEMNGPVQQIGRSVSHVIIYRSTKYTVEAYEIYGYLYLRPGKLLILKSGASNDLLDEAIAEIQHNLNSIKIRSAQGEEQAGLCWKEYFIVDDMSKNIPFTGGYLHFRFPSYPGVRIDIAHRVRLTSDMSLIELMRKNKNELPEIVKVKMKIENLREHQKAINGLAGEEVLNHMSQRGYFERGFEDGAWQYLGSLENDNDPYIKFDFESAELIHNDEPLISTISQKNALRLYDFILNSLQISPNNKKDQ
ncbi:T6SS immunity protein Tli4 family protein [Acinetobacter nematophilus]|uniref:T6SS immunity protein Tli4 family protein n=1 Tax=Acinetobacter nematophilus TaxID=2994642 RepID=A0A9X3DSJ2_9GAMM|nr:T6SS immunity protein Tli4 family protein [Acinetobacter nematophilus]MCX5466346.1 T6SS immunity protein Tli4 family protein [Acinetobacter nematophilus]